MRAAELKRAGLDWKGLVLGRHVTGRLLKVAQLRVDDRFPSEADRVREFVEGGHGSRTTFYNLAKKLRLNTDRASGSPLGVIAGGSL